MTRVGKLIDELKEYWGPRAKGRKAVRSFFPFRKSLVEHPQFKAMPVTYRLYLLWLISEFNLKGEFYRSDQAVAVTLGMSIATIRRARRHEQKLGWVRTKPGFWRKDGSSVATRYLEVGFSQVVEGEFFAPIHRYAFEVMLESLRDGQLTHQQALLYPYVCYFEAEYRHGQDSFFVSKRELAELTGMTDAPTGVRKLSLVSFFQKSQPLFTVTDAYHKLEFTKVAQFADPSEDEHNRKLAEQRRHRLEDKARHARMWEKRLAGDMEPEDLPLLFTQLYHEQYGRKPQIAEHHKEELCLLAEECGARCMAKCLKAYFTAREVANVTGAETRTLANFLQTHGHFLPRSSGQRYVGAVR